MPNRLLTWQRTDLPGRQDDYTGTDPARPEVYARVYLSKQDNAGERPWFWTIIDNDMGISTGYEADVDAAIDAVDHVYAAWQAGNSTS